MGSKRVGVIGGGITGLAAAWDLTQAGAAPVVLESAPRTGGVIVTERRDGFILEGGPDGFLATEQDVQGLAREVGIGDRLVDQLAKGSFVWTGTRLESLGTGEAAALLGIEGQAEGALSKGFRSFAGGMGEIVEAAVARLGATVRTGCGVASLRVVDRGYQARLTSGETVEFDGMICAGPAWVTARLVTGLGVQPARELEKVPYYPSLTVSLAYRTEDVGAQLEGTGFVSKPGVGGALRACTYASLKYPGRAPAGFLLLRAFLSPVEGDAATAAHAELSPILAISGAPAWTRVFHWGRGLPRYQPNHGVQVAAIREQLAAHPPLAIAGAGIDGTGVSACVASGRAAARAILQRLG